MPKVSDLVAARLASYGVRHVFMITGGGAMHLNMSIGRHPAYKCIYNHHEQASAIAAESYARLTGRIAPVCVTTGPGGINALNGVFGAWTDSIPMLVISGQVRFDTTVQSTGLGLRQLGDQEFDIARAVSSMTKYSAMVEKPEEILYHLDRAFHLAMCGRPGPCWVDIPMNVQGAEVREKDLKVYRPSEDAAQLPKPVAMTAAREIVRRVREARRPVILAGTGVRISGGRDEFIAAAEKLNIPVLTAWNAHDVIPDDHRLYFGRPNTVGDRAGNFIIQNADLLISVGCRLNIRQIGYNYKHFAREAYKIIVDIDRLELKKPTVKPDMPVHADAKNFLGAVMRAAGDLPVPPKKEWLDWCADKRRKYPVVSLNQKAWLKKINPYAFVDALSSALAADDVVVCGDGSACVCTFQALRIKDGQRLYTNSGCASMGYDLPAAIGAAAAGARRVVCLAGDGSLQMNIQELQTLSHLRLPVKLFVLNNNGYHSIRQTQHNFFEGGLVGCDPASGVSFPDLSKLAPAYGLHFRRCSSHSELRHAIRETLASHGPSVCELMIDPAQTFEPRVSSRRLPDGTMVSKPLEDMYPFLGRKEFLADMIVKPVNAE